MRLAFLFVPILLSHWVYATGEPLTGQILERDGQGHTLPLVGANVYWLGGTGGVATDAQGRFTIARPPGGEGRLVVSFIGSGADTLDVGPRQAHLEHTMAPHRELEGVTVHGSAPGTHLDRVNPIPTHIITSHELQRAACCNLSESFVTNASVDVTFTDAATGAKQIQLLGLAGVYSQIQIENIPTLRGLSSGYGLMHVPGPWMESIQVSKGTASVAYGYESITGQINVEYQKPWEGGPIFLNGYANSLGRTELNAYGRWHLSPRVSTMLLGHAQHIGREIDHNHDSFRDHPLIGHYHLFNRWAYRGERIESQAGVRLLGESRQGGQMGFRRDTPQLPGNPYGIQVDMDRLDAFNKSAYIFARPATSLGLITAYSSYRKASRWGATRYDGAQRTLHSNLIFITYIGNTNHSVKTGATLNIDGYQELLDTLDLGRREVVPGGYLQYTYKWMDRLTLLAGVRYDWHNLHGGLLTPRVHAHFQPWAQLAIRASAGRGFRSPNPIADNLHLLASAREFVFVEPIRMEEAWTYGLNLVQRYAVNGRELTLSAEFYRTDFVNQLVVDLDQDPRRAMFYNLRGRSFSNSFQAQVSYAPFERLDVSAAYRLNDVWVTTNGQLVRKPLVSRYKGLLTVGYKTPWRRWQVDYTLALNGGGRLPDTRQLPPEYQREATFPPFVTMYAQLTKLFRRWEVYLGVENLTGFKQHNPIISAHNPFGPHFDAATVWGPLSGAKVYAGFRLCIGR